MNDKETTSRRRWREVGYSVEEVPRNCVSNCGRHHDGGAGTPGYPQSVIHYGSLTRPRRGAPHEDDLDLTQH